MSSTPSRKLFRKSKSIRCARGSQIAPKIIAERRAEKFLVDLFVGGKGTALNTLHVSKLLDSVKPMLSLPEVIDGSKWWQGKLRYVDAEEAYVLAFIGNGGGVEEKSSPSIRACAGKTGPCCIFTTARLWGRQPRVMPGLRSQPPVYSLKIPIIHLTPYPASPGITRAPLYCSLYYRQAGCPAVKAMVELLFLDASALLAYRCETSPSRPSDL